MRFSLLLPALVLAAPLAQAEVRLPAIFSQHMVVQREAALPIWGWAEAGEEVRVNLAGQTATTTADAQGKWRVQLAPIAQEGPHVLEVRGKNELRVEDVLAGEVWLGSGQSNMAMAVGAAANYPTERAAANFPKIRMFTVKHGTARSPQEDVKGEWKVCAPEVVGLFSATAYYFGREIHQRTGKAVGLINSSVGGTDIAAWTSEETQRPVPELKGLFEEWQKAQAAWEPVAAKERYEKALAEYPAKVEAARTAGGKAPPKPQAPVEPQFDTNHPANLYNAMIAGLIPYTLRGVIWYQGEHNTYKPERAARYETQLRLLVQDWRQRWNAELPFAWVQLPNFTISPEGRAHVREACLRCLDIPKTGMAITIDVGEPKDNHPKNKQAVGFRLAQWALGTVYKEKVPAISGPLPAGSEVKGSEIHLRFQHTEGGLKARGEELTGFVVAGTDRAWKPAQARISGDHVIIFSPEVPQPVAARYAWGGDPQCNLFNGAGLPASPFRTDDWPLP